MKRTHLLGTSLEVSSRTRQIPGHSRPAAEVAVLDGGAAVLRLPVNDASAEEVAGLYAQALEFQRRVAEMQQALEQALGEEEEVEEGETPGVSGRALFALVGGGVLLPLVLALLCFGALQERGIPALESLAWPLFPLGGVLFFFFGGARALGLGVEPVERQLPASERILRKRDEQVGALGAGSFLLALASGLVLLFSLFGAAGVAEYEGWSVLLLASGFVCLTSSLSAWLFDRLWRPRLRSPFHLETLGMEREVQGQLRLEGAVGMSQEEGFRGVPFPLLRVRDEAGREVSWIRPTAGLLQRGEVRVEEMVRVARAYLAPLNQRARVLEEMEVASRQVEHSLATRRNLQGSGETSLEGGSATLAV